MMMEVVIFTYFFDGGFSKGLLVTFLLGDEIASIVGWLYRVILWLIFLGI